MPLHIVEGDRTSLENRTLEAILQGDYSTSDQLMQSLNTRANLKSVSVQPPEPKHEPIAPHQ